MCISVHVCFSRFLFRWILILENLTFICTGQLGNRRLEPPRFQAFWSKSSETLKGKPIWMAGPNDAVFHLYPYDTSDIYIYFSFGPRSTTSTEYFSMCFCCLVKRTQTNPWPDPHNDGRTRLFFLQELPNLVPNSCDLLLNIGCPNIWLLIISHFFPTSLFWNMNRGARPKFNIEPTNWVLNFWSWFSCYSWRFLGYYIRFWSCGSIPPCLMQPDACWRSKVAFASITLHVVLAMPVPFHACAEPKQQKVRFAPWSGKKLWMHGSQSQCMFMGHMDRLPNNMIWCFGVSKRLTTMGHAPKWQLRRENNDEPKVFWIYLQANPGGIAKWIVPYI